MSHHSLLADPGTPPDEVQLLVRFLAQATGLLVMLANLVLVVHPAPAAEWGKLATSRDPTIVVLHRSRGRAAGRGGRRGGERGRRDEPAGVAVCRVDGGASSSRDRVVVGPYVRVLMLLGDELMVAVLLLERRRSGAVGRGTEARVRGLDRAQVVLHTRERYSHFAVSKKFGKRITYNIKNKETESTLYNC